MFVFLVFVVGRARADRRPTANVRPIFASADDTRRAEEVHVRVRQSHREGARYGPGEDVCVLAALAEVDSSSTHAAAS